MVTSFADPSVNFGVQIKTRNLRDLETDKSADLEKDKNVKEKPKQDMEIGNRSSVASDDGYNEVNQDLQDKGLEQKTDGAEVINIEAFRKRWFRFDLKFS